MMGVVMSWTKADIEVYDFLEVQRGAEACSICEIRSVIYRIEGALIDVYLEGSYDSMRWMSRATRSPMLCYPSKLEAR